LTITFTSLYSIKKFLNNEIFPTLTSNYQVSSQKFTSFLYQLRFKLSSVHYVSNQVDNYQKDFGNSQIKTDWKQLDAGARDSNDTHHILIFCGGSVSSMDWAPTRTEKNNFLAVACNVNDTAFTLGLQQSIKSCVQIYEFNSLVNDE
jgi:hypothetical protein